MRVTRAITNKTAYFSRHPGRTFSKPQPTFRFLFFFCWTIITLNVEISQENVEESSHELSFLQQM